jgi:hypothetical protein
VELKELAAIWADCVKRGFPVIVMCGAHVLKVGLGPLLIQGMKNRWISALALNGAGAVHDFELAFQARLRKTWLRVWRTGHSGWRRRRDGF